MIRLMKADAYRLTKTKGVWIIILAAIVMATMVIQGEAFGSVGVSIDPDQTVNLSWNLLNSIQYAVSSSAFLLYFLIGVLVIILGYEFSQNTYKNTLVSGASRLSFVLAKYLTQLVTIFLVTLAYFAATGLNAYAKYGMGDTTIGAFLKEMFFMTLVLSFLISVVFSFANCLLLLTHSTIIGGVFVVAYSMFIQIIGYLIDWDGLKYLDFLSTAQQISLGAIKGEELIPYLVISAVLIVLSTIVGTLIIRQQEL